MIGVVRPLTIRVQPALEGCHHAGPRELALGEYADELAIVERLAGLAERLQDHLRPAASGDRDRLHRPQEPAQERLLEVRGVDHEADRPIDAGEQEEAVGERDVVGDEKRPPSLGTFVRPRTRTR